MEKQKIILSDNITEALESAIADLKHDKLFMLCDETIKATGYASTRRGRFP